MLPPDKSEIVDVIHQYSHYYDSGLLEQLGELFIEHAVFYFEPPIATLTTLKGREAIVAGLMERHSQTRNSQRRHIITNAVVTQSSETSASVTSYLLLASTTGGRLDILVSGTYSDTLVKRGDRWQFETRRLALDTTLD